MHKQSKCRALILAVSLAVPATACIDEAETTLSIGSTHDPLTAMSEDQRYIVSFANAKGRAALGATTQNVALELPSRGAVAAYIPDHAVAALRANPNILAVEVDARRYPMAQTTPYGITMVQADDPGLPDGSSTANRKVCIIDSGIRGGHEDFNFASIAGNDLPGSGAWNQDLCGHGTHVAGTIAAADNALGVIGVAPNAVDLHIVKVFSGTGCGWTYSSGLTSALAECEAAGANVVSMSLGGTGSSQTEAAAFQSAYDSGVLPIAAAGNSGNTQFSYPASYDAVMSVAAVDASEVVATFSQQNSQVEIAAPGVSVLSTYNVRTVVASGSGTSLANQIEFSAGGSTSGSLVDGGLCDSVGAWAGSVVLCERGVISFNDKVQNVQAGGGAAAVLYNNAPGNFNGTLGEGNSSVIQAVSLSQEDGQSLVAGQLGQIASVDSGIDGDGYAFLDGTSMATPHVSAVAARIWAADPSKTNDEVRNALTASARDLGSAGRDNAYGHGLIQARAAYDALLSGGPICKIEGETCSDGGSDCCDGLSCVGSGKGRNKTFTCQANGGGGDPICGDPGASCKNGSDCCSGVCTGRGNSKTCS